MTTKSSMLLRTSTAMQKKASFMGNRDSENAINRQSSNIIYSIQYCTHYAKCHHNSHLRSSQKILEKREKKNQGNCKIWSQYCVKVQSGHVLYVCQHETFNEQNAALCNNEV